MSSPRRPLSPLLLILVVTTAFLAAPAPTCAANGDWTLAPGIPFLRGAVLAETWDSPSATALGSEATERSLLLLARRGADAVGLTVSGYLADPRSPFLETPSANDPLALERLERTVRAAHRSGLRVVLMPRLSLRSGEWVGRVRMEDELGWREWFEGYQEWIVGWARRARQLDVDLMSVGAELAGTTHREREWRGLVEAVRRAYDGPLTYGADAAGELDRLDFWDALDLIGVQWAVPMSTPGDEDPRPDPLPHVWSAADADSVAVAALAESIRPAVERLEATAVRWSRPVLLTRAAYRSVTAGWRDPTDRRDRGQEVSENHQARAYRALERALHGRSWWRGTLWAPWDGGPPEWEIGSAGSTRGGEDDHEQSRWQRGFSPRGKAAERELGRQWAHPPLGWAAARVRGRGGMVVSSDTLATEVGLQVLREGGNAADAAVATALALAVTMPEAGNLGGGGFALIHDPARGRSLALDFREAAPRRVHPDFYPELREQGLADASREGPLAAAIPGTPAGLHAIWERAGSMPWERLVRPAFRLAAEGFELGEARAAIVAEEESRLRAFASTRAIFLPQGRPLRAGERLRQPALAQTLHRLRREGPGAFYAGAIARDLVEGVRAAGGVWTTADLATYHPRWVRPMRMFLDAERSIELLTMPPPSSAGPVLGQSWELMRRQRAESLPPDGPERARAWVEAFRLAFADRNAHLGDPLHMRVRAETLLSPTYLERRARLLPAPGTAGSSRGVGAGEPSRRSEGTGLPRREPDETTHLVVVDAAGRCVSLTTTLNALFGSGYVEPSTGILLNNQMDDFDTLPGEPNLYGLVGTGVNLVRPGARMLSSMAPCIVLREDRTWLALGGRGGPRILTAVAQILWARIVDGWPLDRAVSAPRLHHQWQPDLVRLEAGRRWPGLAAALENLGYEVEVWSEAGKIHAVERTSDGWLLGIADPREHGYSRSVD